MCIVVVVAVPITTWVIRWVTHKHALIVGAIRLRPLSSVRTLQAHRVPSGRVWASEWHQFAAAAIINNAIVPLLLFGRHPRRYLRLFTCVSICPLAYCSAALVHTYDQ